MDIRLRSGEVQGDGTVREIVGDVEDGKTESFGLQRKCPKGDRAKTV